MTLWSISISGGSEHQQPTIFHVFGRMERIGCQLGVSMGHLFEHERRSNSLVQHYQFTCGGFLSFRYDLAEVIEELKFECNMCVFLWIFAGILTMIMVRTLRRDIARYNTDENYEDTLEETGWKLVHGDVFRPPKHPRLFAAVVGSGIQIFFMALITICKCHFYTLFIRIEDKNKMSPST